MSARTFERRHVIRSPWSSYAKSAGRGRYIVLRPLAQADAWDRAAAERIADELTAFEHRVFDAIPDPRAPRIVRGKGQRRNRRRP